MVTIFSIRAPLFVPANRPERFAKAASSGTDAVILDLEDVVAPEAKLDAHAALTCEFTELPVIVRGNPTGTEWHKDDIEAVRILPVAAVMLPKVGNFEQVGAVGAALAGHAPVLALIESATGQAHSRAIAACSAVERLIVWLDRFLRRSGVRAYPRRSAKRPFRTCSGLASCLYYRAY